MPFDRMMDADNIAIDIDDVKMPHANNLRENKKYLNT